MIAVVKYNAGNIFSVTKALERLGEKFIVTDDEKILREADKVIFPGVGSAQSAMQSLNETGLSQILPTLKQPFLGICLGLQLLLEGSWEGETKTLGITEGVAELFPEREGYKVPEVGWNEVVKIKDDPLFSNIESGAFMYFVHSYYVPMCPEAIAITEYDEVSFTSALKKDNFYGVQFHPEKSGKAGEMLLRNFLKEIK